MNFNLILTAPNIKLYDTFSYHFKAYEESVRIDRNYFQNILKYDCLVAPANSFGRMDGGMDADILEYFGYGLEKRVQEEIIRRYGSFQPLGTSFIIHTGNSKHPFLAHTPTMFIPEDIRGTINPYRAFKAMLLAINEHNASASKRINTVVCPGFGTGVGMMDVEQAARQMALAYELIKTSESIKNPTEVYQLERVLLEKLK